MKAEFSFALNIRRLLFVVASVAALIITSGSEFGAVCVFDTNGHLLGMSRE